MALNLELVKKARVKVALGPYTADRAADVVGQDATISAMERNRHEHPGHYWANPFVRGPLSEIFGRLSRRTNAAAGTSWPQAGLRELSNLGPLAQLGSAGQGLGLVGLGSSALHGVSGGIMGGPKRKEKLRADHDTTEKGYDEREEDKAKIPKDKKHEKTSSLAVYLGQFAAVNSSF